MDLRPSVSCHTHQDPVEDPSATNHVSTATAASPDHDQFSSFRFWREPLPPVDDELLELLVSLDRVHSLLFRQNQRSRDSGGHMTPGWFSPFLSVVPKSSSPAAAVGRGGQGEPG